MSSRKMLSRLAGLSLAAALVAAAPASAMPDEPAGTGAEQRDMHASTVQKQDGTQQSGIADARGEAAAGSGTAGASGGPVREPRLQGPPTWPMHPTPLPRPTQQPVIVASSDDIGLDLPVALLILAGTLALGGGMAAVALKARGRTRTAH